MLYILAQHLYKCFLQHVLHSVHLLFQKTCVADVLVVCTHALDLLPRSDFLHVSFEYTLVCKHSSFANCETALEFKSAIHI